MNDNYDASHTVALQKRYQDICSQVPWTSPIYLPTDKLTLEEKIAGMQRVVELHNVSMPNIYRQKLQALRDRYAGSERAFIVGNGPSLNVTDLHQLKDEVTFCVNGFFLKMPELDWIPTFYVVEDHLVAEDRAAELNKLKGPTKLFPTYLGYCLEEQDDTIFFNHRARKSYPHGFDFSTDASKITYTGCTVTFTCMQLAHYLGFKEIYLVGVDASYAIPDDVERQNSYGTGVFDMNSDDPNHFHSDYFGKGYRWHDPQVDMMIEAYAEARRVTDASGRRIFNATVGGNLETFERRPFQSVFPHAIKPVDFEALEETFPPSSKLTKILEFREKSEDQKSNSHLSSYPRLLVIDMTEVGGVTATGALKQTLLSNWPPERLISVSSNGTDDLVVDGGRLDNVGTPINFTDKNKLFDWLKLYDADVILYRPLPEKPALHKLAMKLVQETKVPIGIWVMDNWLDRLRHRDERSGRYWHHELEQLTKYSKLNLAISEPMARELSLDYGAQFEVISNAVSPIEWPEREYVDNGAIVLRYAGGLAQDMTLRSILQTAEAVEDLSKHFDIKFEIQTRQHWVKQAGTLFSGFSATTLTTDELDDESYKEWLCEADILLLAYNFDPETMRYIRHSMANKIPELLATGRPVLAIGPEGQATLDWLDAHEAACRVKVGNKQSISDELSELCESLEARKNLGKRGRLIAFAERNLPNMRDKFEGHLRAAATSRETPQGAYNPDVMRKAILTMDGIRRTAAQQQADANTTDDVESAANLGGRSGRVKARVKNILKFYSGWRAAVGLLCVAISSLPIASILFPSKILGIVSAIALPFSIVILLLLVGYLFSVLEDAQSSLIQSSNRKKGSSRRTN